MRSSYGRSGTFGSAKGPPQERGPMAHEVTVISDRGVEVGVVEGNAIRVTARPAQQPTK